MALLVPVALLGWIPLVLVIFGVLPPRRAVIAAFIGGWLFLPNAGYILPGVPDYTKRSAAGMAVLLGTILFRSELLFGVRFRWIDLPMTVWCVCPFASSVSNGLGWYDGLSASFENFVSWGLPYLIGRIYFSRLEHLRELAMGIMVGGLIYVPLCLYELRMSPQIHRRVYAMDPGGWGEVMYGGYRPKVFMSCGLELVMWMAATAVTAFWLWASGSVQRFRGYPFLWVMLLIVVVSVMCRGTGATLLMVLGVSLWYGLRLTKKRLPALVLVTLGPLYFFTRTTGLWTGSDATALVETYINARRAESLRFRMFNEDLLAAKALQQPVFGWGGWSRARVFDAEGRDLTITDGMWIIALGNSGLVGLISLNAAMLLPMAIMVKRYPASTWCHPSLAPASACAILANLYHFDCIANAMINPVFMFVVGSVTQVLDRLGGAGGRVLFEALKADAGSTGEIGPALQTSAAGVPLAMPDPRAMSATRQERLGRSLKQQGHPREAEAAWLVALRTWSQLTAESPDHTEYRQHWLDVQNDLAWLLLTVPDRKPDDVARAILLVEKVIERAPKCGAYWNTLGIAYFRGGDPKAAITALERSIELGAGGTSFDYYFLGMAYLCQGDEAEARLWCARAADWMEAHGPNHPDLLRFRAEAAALLDGPAPRG